MPVSGVRQAGEAWAGGKARATTRPSPAQEAQGAVRRLHVRYPTGGLSRSGFAVTAGLARLAANKGTITGLGRRRPTWERGSKLPRQWTVGIQPDPVA